MMDLVLNFVCTFCLISWLKWSLYSDKDFIEVVWTNLLWNFLNWILTEIIHSMCDYRINPCQVEEIAFNRNAWFGLQFGKKCDKVSLAYAWVIVCNIFWEASSGLWYFNFKTILKCFVNINRMSHAS